MQSKIKRGILKQFKATKCSSIDMLKDEINQLPFILKMRRIEYIFESVRQMRDKIISQGKDIDDPSSVSISERADIELIDDLRENSAKYMTLTHIGGLNIGFFTY